MHQYEIDPRQFTDRQAEQIAILARQFGLRFPRESKPIRKFAFDLADTAALGMLPNEWRPRSRGQSVFGETRSDRWAGGLGTGIPLAAGGLLALANPAAVGSMVGKGLGYGAKGARATKRGIESAMGRGGIFERAAEGAGRTYRTAKNTYTSGLPGNAQFGPGFLGMMNAAWNRGAGNPLAMAGRPWGFNPTLV